MYSKETNGITLIALVITIILLLILGGVVLSQLNGGNLIGNATSTTEKSKIESKKEEIQLAITRKMIEADRDITIDDIIAKLEKNGIIDSGNSNSENGQVKTNPDGYVYEIVQDKNGNWNVNYVGKGEIEATKITLATSVDRTGITNKVNITAIAKAKSGVKSIQLPDGTNKTYASGTTTATTTYEVTQNGTYKFTATNNNNESVNKTVAISNILEGEIAIAINPSTPTNKDVTATITWPSGNYSVTKEVSTNGGTTYTTVTGTTTQIIIKANCNIRARIKTASGEIKTKTYEITNIDKTNPTVTAKQSSVTITEGDSNELSNYFNIVSNGKYGISSIVYTDTSNNNEVVTNTNTLAPGTHVIKCTATKETGATANATITIVVEKKNTVITATEVASDASYIGKYVNYTTPSGDPDVKWRIFYADSSNIYLIASYYLKYNYVPTKTKDGTEYKMYKNSDYKLSFDDMYKAYTGSVDIKDARITKWMKWVGQYPSSTNINIRSVAYMLDSNIWNTKYKNSYAEYVLGGPTIEMLCASYKATHPTRYIECESYTTNGYKVKMNTDSSYSDSISRLSTSELENLYVINDRTNANAYWLASPSAGSIVLLTVRCDGLVDRGGAYNFSDVGLRALVCLKSNVQLVPNGNAYDLSMTPTVTAKVTEIEKIANGKDNYSIEDLFNIERSR